MASETLTTSSRSHLLDCGVTLLQCAQSGSHYLAAGCVAAGGNKTIDVTGLLGGQAESSLFR
jgi:hypothetical protein